MPDHVRFKSLNSQEVFVKEKKNVKTANDFFYSFHSPATDRSKITSFSFKASREKNEKPVFIPHLSF